MTKVGYPMLVMVSLSLVCTLLILMLDEERKFFLSTFYTDEVEAGDRLPQKGSVVMEGIEREQQDTITDHRINACSFFDPRINKSNPITCETQSFVSIVKSICISRLGNQLSAYAAVRYFQKKYGMSPIMDPFQMKIITSVFNEANLKVKSLSMGTCCKGRKWNHVRPFEEEKVVSGFSERFEKNPEYYARNFLVNLGSHTVPLFLFKEILPELRTELVFRPEISKLASNMLRNVSGIHGNKRIVYVGVHARRGDRLGLKFFRNTIVGTYEGIYFNRAMDVLRSEYNTATQKVVFLPTSDNYTWIKKQMIDKNDLYFTRELIKETRVHPATQQEIAEIRKNKTLNIKGAISNGVDLAVLALCNHTIMDYGTYGMWAGLLAGGRIILPRGYTNHTTPTKTWWETASMDTVEYIDVSDLRTPESE